MPPLPPFGGSLRAEAVKGLQASPRPGDVPTLIARAETTEMGHRCTQSKHLLSVHLIRHTLARGAKDAAGPGRQHLSKHPVRKELHPQNRIPIYLPVFSRNCVSVDCAFLTFLPSQHLTLEKYSPSLLMEPRKLRRESQCRWDQNKRLVLVLHV